jgi:hypothetical protein
MTQKDSDLLKEKLLELPILPPVLTITVPLPEMSETRRYKQNKQVSQLEAFLVWILNNGYQVRSYDTNYGEWDVVDLADPSEVTSLIQGFLGIDPARLEKERAAVYRLINKLVSEALGV